MVPVRPATSRPETGCLGPVPTPTPPDAGSVSGRPFVVRTTGQPESQMCLESYVAGVVSGSGPRSPGEGVSVLIV